MWWFFLGGIHIWPSICLHIQTTFQRWQPKHDLNSLLAENFQIYSHEMMINSLYKPNSHLQHLGKFNRNISMNALLEGVYTVSKNHECPMRAYINIHFIHAKWTKLLDAALMSKGMGLMCRPQDQSLKKPRTKSKLCLYDAVFNSYKTCTMISIKW